GISHGHLRAQPVEVIAPERVVLPPVVQQRGGQYLPARALDSPADLICQKLPWVGLLGGGRTAGGLPRAAPRASFPWPPRQPTAPAVPAAPGVPAAPAVPTVPAAPGVPGPGCGALLQQPVPQPARGLTVVPVVLGQLGHPGTERLVVTRVLQLESLRIGDHRIRTGGHAVGI